MILARPLACRRERKEAGWRDDSGVMDTNRTIALLAAMLCGAAFLPALAAGEPRCRATSGERVLPLVELYTSEGCDSCPPADRWLGKSFAPDGTVPAGVLAFHVDYWDRLGWPDRFANAAWSARQQAIARASRSATVYTPQVVLQGQDFDWRDAAAMREIAQAAKASPRATIAMDARTQSGRIAVAATARVPVSQDRAGARLVVAYTDGGHVTDVKRGENAGVTLRHEHVVRALAASGAADASGTLKLDASFDVPAEAGPHASLVAFVERDAKREVLQSLSLALDACAR